MNHFKKSRDSVSARAALFLFVYPILAGIAAVLSRIPLFEAYFHEQFCFINFFVSVGLICSFYIVLRVTPLYSSYLARYFVIGLTIVHSALLAFSWGHLVLGLFILPTILAIFFQSRVFVRRVSIISILSACASLAGVYFLGYEKFFNSLGADRAIEILQFSVEGTVLIILCVSTISAAVYNIRFANYQNSLANIIMKSERLGVLSNAQFQISLKHELSTNSGTDYYLICTNVVNFRLYNDLFGFEAGDQLLHKIADVLNGYVGSAGIVGKLDNDHLIFLIPKEKYDSEYICGQLFHSSELTDNKNYTVDVICGVYEISDRRIASNIMCDRAMMASNSTQARKEGISFFRESMIYDAHRSRETLNELQVALKENQFVPYLQAQCDPRGRMVCAEVLARWNHPDRGIVMPKEFISLCEEYGYISDLDRDMWERACETLHRWDEIGYPVSYLSVNVSPIDLYQMNLFEEISNITKKYNLSHDRLHLEITESTMMKNTDKVLGIIKTLRDAGFVVEIDDFGSGFSSLGMLSQLEVDYIKLDVTFVRRLGKEPNAEKVLRRISDLAHDIATRVIVEGVETESHLKVLHALGFDCFQGYYFSKPISVQDFEKKYFGEKALEVARAEEKAREEEKKRTKIHLKKRWSLNLKG